MLDFIFGFFSYDLAIDLGTANTLVAIKDKGIVIREPSVVARHKKNKKVLAVGGEAKKMLGKTPASIEALRPLRHGVISDFDATAAMLTHFIKLVHEHPNRKYLPNIPRPKVVVGIPSGVTEVERRAVQEAALEAGARQCFLIEEPMAAAIGAGLPVEESKGSMIVDIGGGTTEIAVISLGGIVVNRSIRVAGDEMDKRVTALSRLKHSLVIGEQTAEEVKIQIGSAYELGQGNEQTVIRGRDLETGLPKSIKINSVEVREALSEVVNEIISGVKEVIEETPPEFIGDIMEQGITVAGGGGKLKGIDKLISQEIRMPILVAEDPQTAVVRGALNLLSNEKLLNRVKVTGGLK